MLSEINTHPCLIMVKNTQDIALYTIEMLRKVVLMDENEEVLIQKITQIKKETIRKFHVLFIEAITERLLCSIQRSIKNSKEINMSSLDSLFYSVNKKDKKQSYLEILQEMKSEIINSLELTKSVFGYIKNNETIMVYGDSDLLCLFIKKAKEIFFFRVVLVKNKTENKKMVETLKKEDIPFKQIEYSSSFCFISVVDNVLMDCELITQSGGCVSESGTLLIAASAYEKKVPVMIVCATYMFCRGYTAGFKKNIPFCWSPFFVFKENEDQLEENTIRVIFPMFDYIPSNIIKRFLSGEGSYLPANIEFVEREMNFE